MSGRGDEIYNFAVNGGLGQDGAVFRRGGFVFTGIGVGIVVDGVEAAKEKAADVSEGGSAARRDASAGEELVECGEGIIDALGIEKFGSIFGESGGDIVVVVQLGCSVLGAVSGFKIVHPARALPSSRGAVLAALVGED